MVKYLFTFLIILIFENSIAQFEFDNQIIQKNYTEEIVDSVNGIIIYEPLNLYLKSDSTRIEGGYAVNGWKEDHYNNGQLLHRGFYLDGQLKVYKNYYPNGKLERSFKNYETYKSKEILNYPSGEIKKLSYYLNNFAIEKIHYNINGKIKYHVKFNEDLVSFEKEIKYYENGNKKKEQLLNNEKKKTYFFIEYFMDGSTKTKGQLKFNIDSKDYDKFGKWIYYDNNGKIKKKIQF